MRWEKKSHCQRDGVAFEEVIPGAGASCRAGIEAVLTEDAADGVAGDVANAELSEFAKYSRIPPGVLAGELDDQFANVDRLPPAAAFPGNPFSFALSNPAEDGARRDDGGEGVNGLPDFGRELVSRRRSTGVIAIRLGNLLRRIWFSTLR